MAATNSTPARRRHQRNRVFVMVRWHNRMEEGVSAEVHDVSAEGLFIVPEGPLPEKVLVGDTVWVVVSTAAGDCVLTGIVRWRGFHPAHSVIGCGIQLDADSVAQVRRVFPVIDLA